ncbi:MAG: hypothetical protein L0Z55_11195 [Planctomycetes bacterium]|nr:hypothetical protein [Planctomycetota bacterium]
MKSRAFILIFASLALLLSLGLLLRSDRSGDSTATPQEIVRAGAPGSEALPPAEFANSEVEAELALSETPSATVPAGAPTAGESIFVEGTVVVLDAGGTEHASEDGAFVVNAWSDAVGEQKFDVQVTAGRWSAEIPAHRHIAIESIVMNGRRAEPSVRGYGSLPEDRHLEVRAGWIETQYLHVISADTGRELSDVMVVTSREHDYSSAEHPGPRSEYKIVLDGQQSPFEILLLGNISNYWIGAPGHAWERVKPDPRVGADRTVALDAAGELVIELAGEPAEQGLRLSIRRHREEEPRSAAETEALEAAAKAAGIEGLSRSINTSLVAICDPGDGNEILIPQLRAGHYAIDAGLGNWVPSHMVLATAQVDVQAGMQSRVRLELKAAPPVPKAIELAGTIMVPDAWGPIAPEFLMFPLDDVARGRQEMVFVPRTQFRAVEGSPCVFAWTAGSVLAGRYHLHVEPLGYHEIVTIQELEGTPLEITVPEPGTLWVEVVGADSGEQIRDARVSWHVALPNEVTAKGFSPEDAKFDDESGRYEIRAPIGEIKVSVGASLFAHARLDVEVELEEQFRRVELRREWAIAIRAIDPDGHPIEGRLVRATVEGAGNFGQWGKRWSHGSFEFKTWVAAPGLYRVKLNPIEGYVAPPPPEVTVGEDGAVVTFELVPSR